MSTTTAQPLSLKVSRLIKAPRERVFAAWTTPADIMKWFGCSGSYLVSADVDARAGGAYRFVVKSDEMGEFEMHGVYQEVKRPERLVMTWNSTGCAATASETLVTVDLLAKGTSTEVQITHERFADAESRDRHNYGWNSCLENIAKLVDNA